MKPSICFTAAAVVLFFTVPLFAGNLSDSEFNELKKELTEAIKSPNPLSALPAIEKLSKDDSERMVQVIIDVLLGAENMKIFSAGKEALGKVTSEEAVKAILARAKNANYRVRIIIAEVLPFVKSDKAFQTLVDMLNDQRDEVVATAIQSLGETKKQEAVSPLVQLLKTNEARGGAICSDIVEALRKIAGIEGECPTRAVDWENYWQARREREKEGSPETANPAKQNEGPKTTFFGREIFSKRIIFLIDVSGSMVVTDLLKGSSDRPRTSGGGGEPAEPGGRPSSDPSRQRIERAKNELIKVVNALPTDAKFNIIAFSTGIKTWKENLVSASKANREDAVEFVKKFNPIGATYTDEALEKAFTDKEIDTIYLLTDGAPMKWGRGDPRNETLRPQILEKVQALNKFRKVRIFAFGFEGEGEWPPQLGRKPSGEEAQKMVDFLKQLARENGGQYTPIE